MDLKVKLLHEHAVPYKAHADDAGCDLKAKIPKLISLGQFSTTLVPTGVCVEIPRDHVGLLLPRSSMNKAGIGCEVGVIDAGYTGEISVCLTNNTATPYHVNPFDRIAQLVVMPIVPVNKIVFVDKFDTTERGDAGFGSSGK